MSVGHKLRFEINTVENSGLTSNIKARARSLAIILFVGLLFLASILFKNIETIAGNYLEGFFHANDHYFNTIISSLINLVIQCAWFIILFRFLSDARPRWKAAITGGTLTAILFTIGTWILKVLLLNSNLSLFYGASGSFVVLLLFMFYVSFILYFGACFINIYSKKKQWKLSDKN